MQQQDTLLDFVNKIQKILNRTIILILLTGFLTAGCVSDVVQDTNASRINNKTEGYVALSVVCVSDQNLPINIYYNEVEFHMNPYLMESEKMIRVYCENNKPQYFLLKLPAFTYKITGFEMPSNQHTTGYDFKGTIFKVYPQRVNYIGRLYIESYEQKSKKKSIFF